VIHRSQHPDISLCDVLSYMLMLMSSLASLSLSVSTALRGKSYSISTISHTTLLTVSSYSLGIYNISLSVSTALRVTL
jgi:hypothetical protein